MTDLKAAYESLSNPDVTKRDFDAAQAALSQQAADIWRYICKQSHRSLGWDLASVIGPETVTMQGDYGDFVTEVDDYETYDNKYYKYVKGFPTELLWTPDWQAVVDKHIADAVENFTTDRRAKLANNKVKKAAKKARQHEAHQLELQTKIRDNLVKEAVLNKAKAGQPLADEEYQWLLTKLA